ncbi:O-glucosyltransferase [Canna indica]|uniref:O-glucosyltransferase n=1 Tax=Canna indica TaxID=4628 RepID=A0AAQ3QAZ3_9LILI|nr:O-glucosyltransferase [Canna indica]
MCLMYCFCQILDDLLPTMWPPLRKKSRAPGSASSSSSTSSISAMLAVLLLFLIVGGAFVPGQWIRDTSTMGELSHAIMSHKPIINHTVDAQPPPLQHLHQDQTPVPTATVKQALRNETNPITMTESIFSNQPPSPNPKPTQAAAAITPLVCPTGYQTANGFCPSSKSKVSAPTESIAPSSSCPDYFRWIYEDLRPWMSTGITRRMVEKAKRTANFRLVVVGGKAYVQRYHQSYQTRDVFTIWGILQLLRRYPGRVPDLDLMFDCVDWPVVRASDYQRRNASTPPPLFRYCGDDSTLDIVFPDWSFWGWPEINIKPWELLRGELKEGNDRVKWRDREPYAYWKGNPAVAITRQDLLKCNVSEGHDWNARLYAQDWFKESKGGFKESNLANQCKHRYKIYIEGSAWSVSEKYILACDSLTLMVTPKYYDFFTRGLMPVQHYWPIREDDKCRSIKFAVDWGNSHKEKTQTIGKEASNFVLEKMNMEYVYDYMFHLLSEYAKLLRYKPTIPREAVEFCAESMACPASGLEKKFMMDSLVRLARDSSPCAMPPRYGTSELKRLARQKANAIKQVEMWQQRATEALEKKV